MNTNQKSMRYDQNDYDALLHSKIPAGSGRNSADELR